MMRGTRVYGIIGEIFMRGELTLMLELRLYISNGISHQPSDPVLITGSACSDEELHHIDSFYIVVDM